MSRRSIIWLIPTLLTLHNAEEALAFRHFWPRTQTLLTEIFPAAETHLTYKVFVLALVGLSSGAFLLTFLVEACPQFPRLLWLLLALEAAVGLNVLSHLVSAALLFRGYGPGLVTALVVNTPFAVYCFTRASRERWISPAALVATVPAAFLLHGPVLVAGLWMTALLST